jgi:anionic cell wall polymer biosynthesis LytR-Cps2A-Psr (LCP) family protein
MATVVAIMDEPGLRANTDVLVLVEPERRRLLWVPRDLFSETVGGRINEAFRRGGAEALLSALAEHGLDAQHLICLGRETTEAALEGVRVEVFVPERMEFLYPLPGMTVPEGNRRIVFEPPMELLEGERIHEWIGSRFKPNGRPGSDLERIERQKLFVVALLDGGFDFTRVMRPGLSVSLSGPEALAELRGVRAGWALETFGDLIPATIDGKEVLRARE